MWAEKAYKLACEAHAGQVDKGGNPYIQHPETVAGMVDSDEEKAAAYLHDVLEDTDVTIEQLIDAGFPYDIIRAVLLLTKQPGQDYHEYLALIKGKPIARKVKIADLRHNMDISRLGREPTPDDVARINKYQSAMKFLIE